MLKPESCPCCAADLYTTDEGKSWRHPFAYIDELPCVLSSIILRGEHKIGQWNRRSGVTVKVNGERQSELNAYIQDYVIRAHGSQENDYEDRMNTAHDLRTMALTMIEVAEAFADESGTTEISDMDRLVDRLKEYAGVK